ncbi:hypothetical protein TTHERM_00128950 (macronuclear) [Tetrahymena thermophila SB210]|uniref:EF-hand domain-containing protein n=1 Tax=Tetrahymena thermophila (strain SB210) TaxID=312017 RepID=I7M7W4_TETTS|nr:hypothetical protein TTHERM_00128950 [Tetrahymena thermophila SB210]EAR96131.2 hypothetical protein TTHERM_00128950 [Tetrahymena thermophila SB210]|eukprot:XP_001016376.2 hypothetical protein TTHERM_00128950 [Tetrahymena thermophila SB210]
MNAKNHLQLQTPKSPSSYKNYTFDALQNLTQKIHEISEFEHKNYFSTTATHFRIKKGIQLDKTPAMPPQSQEGSQRAEPRYRLVKTAGENIRRVFKSSLKQQRDHKDDQLQIQSGSDLNFITISNFNKQTNGFQTNKIERSHEQSKINLNSNNHLKKRNIQSSQSSQKNFKLNYTGNNFFKSPASTNKFNSVAEIDDQILDPTSIQTKSKVKIHVQNLIQNPQQFYHLKTVGFKNYKYPRPPQTDQMYSPDSRHRVPLYLVKEPVKQDANSIESVCVQKVQQDKYIYQSLCDSVHNSKERNEFASTQLQNNNYVSSSMEEDTREIANNRSPFFNNPYGNIENKQEKIKKSQKYGNKLLFEMDQYNRMVNLYNLEQKIEQKNNQIHRNIFSRWKQRDSNTSLNSQKNQFMSEQVSPKNSILKNHNPNLKIVQIDKIQMNEEEGADRNQKHRSSIQAVRMNQQSKSKKLTVIIEMYNKLVRISEKHRQNGLMLEGESPQKQNKLKILELVDESKANIFKNQQQIYLGVFVQSFEILYQNKKQITQRILLALGLDPDKEFSYVSLEQIIAFYRILIHKDSAISETIKFLEKFFKENKQQELEKEEFKRIIKLLCQQVDEKKQDYQKSVYEYLIEKFEESGVINLIDEYISFKKFKQIFISNTLNIYDIIDLICGIRD